MIFTDNILKGIQMQIFNHLIKICQAEILNFPSVLSHHLLHYLGVHLKDKSIDTTIILTE